jgi:tRNA(Glu) U13 pseudouridine synthase TruD
VGAAAAAADHRDGVGGWRRVGAALLRGDWKGAVELVLAPSPGERADVAAARRAYTDRGDAAVSGHTQ